MKNLPDDVSESDPFAPWNEPDEWVCAGCDNVFDWADEEPATEKSVATVETVRLCRVCAAREE